MTKAKHTPGPWSSLVYARTAAVHGGDGARVAVVYGGGDGDTAEANANLIAAAPDMLEALVEAAGVLPVAGHLHPKDLHRVQTLLVTAIAKARGEAV